MSAFGGKEKGKFAAPGLSVKPSYLYPVSRSRYLWIGCALLAGAGLYLGNDFYRRGGGALSNGPLSFNHANLEADCGACHASFGSVESQACTVCHEKFGDHLGVYGYAAHYVYRSGDLQRVRTGEGEVACAGCHVEHEGREAAITPVPDAECRTCHPFDSFVDGHPQFDFVAQPLSDAASLRFTHIHHVREVMKREQLTDLERACLYCHVGRQDGKRFEPIRFDRHCDSCHLTTGSATPLLPVATPGSVGVETLETIQQRRAPGTEWAFYMNPNELQSRGPMVRKAPVHHEDPWIMENLARLRRLLYQDLGLAGLLRTAPDSDPKAVGQLHREAIATLESYALGLRSRPEPEIQAELGRIDSLLETLQRRLRDPYAPLDETRFTLALERRESIDDEGVRELEELVALLTQPCVKCHALDRAFIARVDTDQGTLDRAEFDHRAHILEVRCLECHTGIPIAELLDSEEVNPALDNAAIHNLPAIEKCRECHNSELAATSCVTCHYFHPNKTQRSNLLLYVEPE